MKLQRLLAAGALALAASLFAVPAANADETATVSVLHAVPGAVVEISVGIFAAGTPARFFIDDVLMEASYLIVDLSNEEFDDEPRHSGDTTMRGELRA